MNRNLLRLRSAALVTFVLGAANAMAAFPATVAGTTWLLLTNRTESELVIDTQSGPGAPGAENCRRITGALNGIASIRGFYCPPTGRIHFLHRNANNQNTVRVYTGNVSEVAAAGEALFIAGTVAVDDAAFGPLGEQNFNAVGQ